MLDLLPVSAAADELSVHPSRVRALIASGALAAEKVGGVWLVDRASVAGRNRAHASAGRPLSPRNAWALLLAASGEALPSGLEPSVRWRLRRALEIYGLGARALPGAPSPVRTGRWPASCRPYTTVRIWRSAVHRQPRRTISVSWARMPSTPTCPHA